MAGWVLAHAWVIQRLFALTMVEQCDLVVTNHLLVDSDSSLIMKASQYSTIIRFRCFFSKGGSGSSLSGVGSGNHPFTITKAVGLCVVSSVLEG